MDCLPLSQRRQEARLILFYKITNGLAQVPFESVLIETYKSTRRNSPSAKQQIGLEVGSGVYTMFLMDSGSQHHI